MPQDCEGLHPYSAVFVKDVSRLNLFKQTFRFKNLLDSVGFFDDVITSWEAIAVIQGFVNGVIGIDREWPNVAFLFGKANETTQDEQCQLHLNVQTDDQCNNN